MEKIEFENKLLEAIKRDDLKSFCLLMPTNADLNLCYGRFPILSLLYLYSSFNILTKFEKVLMPIHNFKFTNERLDVYKEFKKFARKSLRLFRDDEIIYPVLMLAVLNERNIIECNYKFLYKNVEINDKLQKIYKINHNINSVIGEDKIKLQTPEITKRQTFLFSIFSVICCVIIAFSSSIMLVVKNKIGFGSVVNPLKIKTEEEFFQALEQGDRNYVLQNNLEIDVSDFVCNDFSGKLLGNDFTVSVVGDINSSMIKNLTGSVENLNIKLISNKINLTQNMSILAENSTGKIENCSITGEFDGVFNSSEEVFAGLFVSSNLGEIKDSDVCVSANLNNMQESNAYFGLIAGLNEGTISSCKTDMGSIVADTVDISGIACLNRGVIQDSENKIMLKQSSDKQWHPNVAGVSVINYGKIIRSQNHAELEAVSNVVAQNDNVYYVFIAGISCENYGAIDSCKNYGKITAIGKSANIISGGISAQNIEEENFKGSVTSTLSKADIEVFSEMGVVCVGGVVGLNATALSNSGFIGIIDAETKATDDKDMFFGGLDKIVTIYAGGVVGVSQYSEIKNCYADVSYLADGNVVQKSEEGGPQKLYAGVVGNIGVFDYNEVFLPIKPYILNTLTNLDNNYYVQKEEISEGAYGVYATTANLSYQKLELVKMNKDILGDKQTKFNKSLSLQDIPLGVIYE